MKVAGSDIFSSDFVKYIKHKPGGICVIKVALFFNAERGICTL